MSRFNRLTSISLSSYAAYLLLAACSDGGAGNDNSLDPGGNAAGSAVVSHGGVLSSAGSSIGVPNSPVAGQSTGGAPGAGAGGMAAAGVANGGVATSGAAGTATSGAGGVASGGTGSGAGGALGGTGAGGRGGTSSAGAGGNAGSSNPPACTNAAEILCSGACVDTKTSEQHCGGCGKVCANGQQCENSSCKCSGSLALCNNACVDNKTDEQNCGACGTKCTQDQTCEAGKCTGGTVSGTTCSSITEFGVVSSTIVVKNGETYDGKCRRYHADPKTLGDGTQAEGQKPVFEVENGGKLINVVLGAPAADGIHTKGNATLENITWEDIGEDAMTIKESGTVTLNGGSAKNGDDKVFQINAVATFKVSNFKASNAGKFIRQNGGTTYKVQVFIDKCDISDMDEAIFRTDSSSSTVSMTNTRYHAIGDSNFIGVSAGNITQSNNTSY